MENKNKNKFLNEKSINICFGNVESKLKRFYKALMQQSGALHEGRKLGMSLMVHGCQGLFMCHNFFFKNKLLI